MPSHDRHEAGGRDIGRWLYASLVARPAIALYTRAGFFTHLRELREIQFESPARLRQRQAARLAEIVNFARENSAYYRDRWPDAQPLGAENVYERIVELPTVTKQDLQQNVDQIRSGGAGSTVRKVTGGSTGEAVVVVKNRDALASELAATWLAYGWMGIHLGDRAARFWGRGYTVSRRLRAKAADFAMRRTTFSAFAFNDSDLEQYWRTCVALRPVYFYGYASMLESFARYVVDSGKDGRQLGVRAIISTAEVLGDTQRALLEDAFGAPVQNEYGCGEVGPIAYECERHSGLHMMTQNLYVELLRPNGRPAEPGDSGEVVVTDLSNRAMPLVRYRVGDFAQLGDGCDCGRGFPTLSRVWGRSYDFVESPDGRRFHGEFFMYLFEDLRSIGVRRFQVVQRGPLEIEIAIICPPATLRTASDRIVAVLAERLHGMRVSVHRVDDIPRASSGKLRLIVNERDGSHEENPSNRPEA